jgi:hypothetical protein
MPKNDTPGWAELIENSQKPPAARAALENKDPLSSILETRLPAGHRLINMDDENDPDKIPGAVGYEFDPHVKFFSIPKDSADYEAVIADVLQKKAIVRYEERTFTKDGDFLVVVFYLTPRPVPVRPRDENDHDDDGDEPEEPFRTQ